jgi:murein DD-endopeptidase MepM/ murein hydrolase activator NlpD
MGGLTRNLGYMGTSIASAGVGAGRVAGRGIGALGSAAYGLVGGNPLLAGAMVGLGGYMAYDSLIKDKSSGAYKDMSGALDPYFAAGGITGPGAVAAPSASTYTPPTTVRGAKTVRNADVVQTGMSTFKLSQPQLNQYKNDPAGATTYLASQFDMMKHNPEALNTLKLDLVKMYGADEAQSILSNLSSGASFDAGQFISRSLNTKGRGDNWFTKSVVYRGDEARADVARPLNQLSSIYEDQYRMANRIQGPEAAMATRARQMMSSVGMFTRQGGLKRLNEKEEEQRGFADFIAKTFQAEGFTGGDLFQRTTDSSFGANTFDAGKGASEQEQYRHFLGQMLPTLTTQGRGKFLGQFGVDRNVENQDAINSIMRLIGGDYSKAGLQADPDSLEARLSKVASGQGVGGVLGSKSFSAALGAEGDVNKQILAVKDLLDSMVEAGKSAPEIEKVLGSFRAEAVEGAQYDLFAAAQEFNRREMGYSMADMSRTEQYGAQRELYRQRMDIPAGDPQAQAQQEQARAEIFQADQEQKNYFIGLLTAQREFNISRRRGEEDFAVQRERMDIQYNLSRERAQTDFNTQRAYQEFDYQLSRRRAEADFERQSERGSEDYYRSLSRQRADYNLSRRRQEQDFNHQVEVMTESAAKNVYNIYDRIQVQRTSSAGYLLANAGEQLEAMRTQSDDLDKLRKAGVSDDVIQQMGLTDAKNAQQLSRFVGDIAEDPNLVKEFNKAVGQRLKAAKGLVTDESSQEWQEFNRQHNLARKRGEADFERSVNRSMADFNRNMNRMNRDFRRSMSEQATDYERATERANIAFDLSMDRAADDYDTSITNMVNDFDKQMGRAADDLDRMSRTISGTMEEILAKSVKKLSGHAKQQAQAVKNEFEGVENSYERVATRIMRNLASIFGVDFKAPKGVSSKGGAAAGNEGGVGGHSTDDDPRTKGRGGGGGGSPQVPLPAGSYVTGYNEWGERNPRYAKGYHTGDDYSAPAGTPILAALAGKVAIAGDGGAYGNYVVIDHGGGLQTLYGHQSHLGVQKGDMVNAGQRIGSVGSTGNSDGNHLHFEVRMNGQDVDPDSLGKFASGKGIGQYGAARPGDVLQNRYEKLERLTAQMSNIHVLQDGDISKIMNRFGRAAIQRMEQQSGTSLGAAAGASGNVHVGDFEVPSNVKGNVALGKKMAADLKGWKGDQWSALYRLWTAESGWRTNADNPTSSAYGIPQALIALHNMPKGYSDYTRGSGKYTEGFGGDPRVQIGWGLNYIAGSYGDPKSAWGFHQRNNWYGEGAIFDGGAQTIGVGERGAEIVMPLDRKGVDFLAALMERVSPGLDGRNTNTGGYSQPICAHTVNTYQIDRSTSFTGPITVQANDPNQFIGELRNRERARALSQAAIGGRRV